MNKCLVLSMFLIGACQLDTRPPHNENVIDAGVDASFNSSAGSGGQGQAGVGSNAGSGGTAGSEPVQPQAGTGGTASGGTGGNPPIIPEAGTGGLGGTGDSAGAAGSGGAGNGSVAGSPSEPVGGTGSMGGAVSTGGAGGTISEPEPVLCSAGFVLNNNVCIDINECLVNNGGCRALDCVNEPGGFSCALPNATWRNIEVQQAEVTPTQIVQSQRAECRVTFHNNGVADYVMPRLIITFRAPRQSNFGGVADDVLDQQNVIIPANGGVTRTASFEFRTDRPIGEWRCYGTHQDNAGGWHDGMSASVSVNALQLSQSPTSPMFFPLPFYGGPSSFQVPITQLQQYSVWASLQNNNNFAVEVKRLVVAARDPMGNRQNGPFYDLKPEANGVLSPGSQLSVQASRFFQDNDPTGIWDVYVTWQDVYNVWHDSVSYPLNVTALDYEVQTPQLFAGPEIIVNFEASAVSSDLGAGVRLVLSGLSTDIPYMVSWGLNCEGRRGSRQQTSQSLAAGRTPSLPNGDELISFRMTNFAIRNFSIAEFDFNMNEPVLSTCTNFENVIAGVPSN